MDEFVEFREEEVMGNDEAQEEEIKDDEYEDLEVIDLGKVIE